MVVLVLLMMEIVIMCHWWIGPFRVRVLRIHRVIGKRIMISELIMMRIMILSRLRMIIGIVIAGIVIGTARCADNEADYGNDHNRDQADRKKIKYDEWRHGSKIGRSRTVVSGEYEKISVNYQSPYLFTADHFVVFTT